MILIADGGATKCDWVLLDQNKNEILKANTIGFNPNVIKHELILEELLKNRDLLPIKNKVEKLFFYGAGCGFSKNKEILATELKKFFKRFHITDKNFSKKVF